MLKDAITQFHKTIDTIEINKQLNGIVLDDGNHVTPVLEYELVDRAAAAKLLFQPLEGLEAFWVIQMRFDAIKHMVKLCHQRATPHYYKSRRELPLAESHIPLRLDLQTTPDAVNISQKGYLICAFCRWGRDVVGSHQQNHVFLRIDNLHIHIKRWHFEKVKAKKVVACPYPGCSAPIKSVMHFKSHAKHKHGLC